MIHNKNYHKKVFEVYCIKGHHNFKQIKTKTKTKNQRQTKPPNSTKQNKRQRERKREKMYLAKCSVACQKNHEFKVSFGYLRVFEASLNYMTLCFETMT